MKRREFSLYDIEQFLRDAGAERVNEKAIISLEKELEDTVKELVDEASVYADYAGRSRLINVADIELAGRNGDGRPSLKARARRARPQPQRLATNRIRLQRISRLVEAKMLEQ